MTSATTLAAIEARLRGNSELLEAISTLRAAKVVVLDGFSYPELIYGLLRYCKITIQITGTGLLSYIRSFSEVLIFNF